MDEEELRRKEADIERTLLTLGLSDDESLLLDIEEETCKPIVHDNTHHELRAQLNEYREEATLELDQLKKKLEVAEQTNQNERLEARKKYTSILKRLLKSNFHLKSRESLLGEEINELKNKKFSLEEKCQELFQDKQQLEDTLEERNKELEETRNKCLRIKRSMKILQMQRGATNSDELEKLQTDNRNILRENKRLLAELSSREEASDFKENIDLNSGIGTIIQSFKDKYSRLEKVNRELRMKLIAEMDSKLVIINEMKSKVKKT